MMLFNFDFIEFAYCFKMVYISVKLLVVCSVNQIIDAIKNELWGSRCLFGYRFMHQKLCCSYGLVADRTDRETVGVALQALDPEGVARRSRKRLIRRKYHANGPNFI